MSIADKLLALNQAKTDIANKIVEKGGTVNAGDGFADFAADIDTISTGGGGGDDNQLAGFIDGTIEDLVVPQGTRAIRNYAAYNAESLKTVDIKEGAESIGARAFYGCTGLTSVIIPNSVKSIGGYAFYNDTALTDVVMPAEMDSLSGTYVFNGCSKLENINIPENITSVGEYYFYGCSKMRTPTLPSTITNIGQYAFRSAGTGNETVFEPSDICAINTRAFEYSSLLKKLKGKFSFVGTYNFQGTSIPEVDIETNSIPAYCFYRSTSGGSKKLRISGINGAIGASAFDLCTAIEEIEIDTNCNITSLGTDAFRGVGKGRYRPQDNRFIYDLRNSTFTSVPTCFGGSSSTYTTSYITIYLPSTVTILRAYCFAFVTGIKVYFTSIVPPTVENSNWITNSYNPLIFVPYEAINAYMTETNITSHADYIRGYAPANTFAQGETLPTTNTEGYNLVWYADEDLTMQVTTVEDSSKEYYCVINE